MMRSKLAELQDLVIFRDEDGTYNLFGKYIITKHSALEFIVTAPRSDIFISFGTLRNATAWCIMDKRNQLYEASRIKELDRSLLGIDLGVAQHQKLLKKAKTSDEQLIYFIKLAEERSQKAQIMKELNGYILNTKMWQTKRFTQ